MSIHEKYRFPFASYPAARLAILIAAGIVLDYHLGISTAVWICIFAPAALIYIIGETTYQRKLRSNVYNLTIICYLLMIVSFGGTWHSMFDYREPQVEAEVLNTYTWEDLTISGTVKQIKQTSTGKFQIDVAADSTVFPGDITWPKSYKLRAVLNPDDLSFPTDLKLGDRITFLATVYPLEDKSNPHDFDYKQYLASKRIYTQVGIQKIYQIQPTSKTISWPKFRQLVLDAIDNNFDSNTASLAKALLIGYKNELDREEKIAFSRAGLSHIMAVSGLHVGFILAPFWIIIPYFWAFKYGKQIGLVCLVGLLFVYAGLTGFSASVTRASLAGGFLAYGRLFHKVRDSKNLTAVAALIILLYNPGDLFAIGFQLSFGAVYVILLTAPVINRGLPNWIRYRWHGKLLMVVIISLIVQIGLFPFLAYYFGEFSIVGPLANAFVVPILGFAVPFALLLLPIAMIFPDFAHFLNIPVELFLYGLDWFVNYTAGLEWSWIQVHIDSLLFFGIWIAAIFFIASIPIPKMRWKLLAIFLAILCVDQGSNLIQKITPAKLAITVFDVGQGDAALISTPNNKHFLIDTGRWQPDYNSAKYVILPHLKANGIEKLDAIFHSHPHADHIGGTPELIKQIPIDTIYNSGADYDSQLYETYRKAAADNHIPVVSLSAGDQLSIDPTIRLFVYGPPDNSSDHNVNNRSLILELVYGNTEFLFMGDAERGQERRLITKYPYLTDTDFLKVAHHGSKTSSISAFLDTVTANQAVVSLGRQNQFQHPHPEAIQRLRSDSVKLHFTSLDGAIRIYSDGNEIYVEE